LPQLERELLPGLQTRTTEAVEPNVSILRSSECVSKKGHADGFLPLQTLFGEVGSVFFYKA